VSTHQKVHFPLVPDADGWPPASVESLWARRTGRADELVIDNTPFFVRGIAWLDLIRVVAGADGRLEFAGLVSESGHSTVRVIVLDDAEMGRLRDHAELMGCACELIRAYPNLAALDVPPVVDYADVKAWLDARETVGRLGYEEGCISEHHRIGSGLARGVGLAR
jgi:uncharacterized protein DUF4265